MIADGSGAADVLVLKGMVETSSHDSAGQRTIVLHENQSRHFARSGISKVSDPEQKFARVEPVGAARPLRSGDQVRALVL